MVGFDRIGVGFAKNEKKCHLGLALCTCPVIRMAACPPCDEELDLEEEWRRLDALPVVDTIRSDKVIEKG